MTTHRWNYRWWLLAALGLLGGKAWLSILWEYRWYFPPDFEQAAFLIGRRTSFEGLYRIAFYTHILSSPIALGAGTILLLSGRSMWKQDAGLTVLQPRLGRWHRRLGMFQIGLVMLAVTPSGLVMAVDTHYGWLSAIAFVGQAVSTGTVALFAIYFAFRRQFVRHQSWATRLWLLLCGPLLFRLLMGLAVKLQLDIVATYQVAAWICWLGPLLVIDLLALMARIMHTRERLTLIEHDC